MISSPSRKLALLTALGVVCSGSAVALAGGPGQTVEIASQIKVRNSAPAFHGKVTADNDACVEQRTVKMFKQKRNGGKKLLGKTQTANSGKWTVPFDNLASGAYYGIVKKLEQGTAGTIYVCLRARSKTLTVD